MKRITRAALAAVVLAAAVAGLSGCYATSASVGVGVETAPPAGVYYDYGYRSGYVFIDGHWVWTAYGWQWYPGYWVAERPGFVYINGYWDYWGGHYYWRPGVWSHYRNGYAYVGGSWRPYQRGARWDYRNHTWVNRGGGGYYHGGLGGPRDHRGETYRSYQSGRPAPTSSPRVYQRSYGAPGSRDHRHR